MRTIEKREMRRRAPIGAMAAGVALATGLAVTSPADAIIVIDNFSQVGSPDPWPVVINTESSQVVTEGLFSNTDVIGGTRTTTITAGTLLTPGLDLITASVFPIGEMGLLDFSSTIGAAGSLNLTYDADGAGLGVDLSSDLGIEIDFELFDLSNGEPLNIMMTLIDGNGNMFVRSVQLTVPGTQTAQLNFGDVGGLSGFGNDSFDLSDIDSISLDFDGALGTDFRVSEARTFVPAPGALTLLLAAGIVPRRRRRR